MSDSRLNRRRFLAAAGVAGVVGVAGCGEADAPAASGDGDTLYIGPDGDNNNPGTEAEPLATIEYALEAAAPGETVHVLPGTYHENVRVNEDRSGQPGDPITLTGPPDAVVKSANETGPIFNINESHFHVTGLTIDGLVDPDRPDDHESYVETQLIGVSPRDPDPQDPEYIENLALSPHRMGNTQSAFINAALLKDSEIGGFEVIGPAGTYWLLRNEVGEPIPDHFTTGHNGEFVYLGTAPGNLKRNQGIEVYDRTRNIRVHHIDNSAGYGHSQLVDCKSGTENITVEYCTDAWGSRQAYEADRTATLRSQGHNNTFRWNVIRGTRGDVVEITRTYLDDDFTNINDRGPETPLEERFGTETAVYGNYFTEYTFQALAFPQTHRQDPQMDRSTPEKQSALCGNTIDGPTDASPEDNCGADVPESDGIGHLGGDSPWRDDGDPGGIDAVREAMGVSAFQVDATLETETIGVTTDLVVTAEVTNTGDVRGRKRVRCDVGGVRADGAQVTLDPGEATTVTLEAQPVFGWTIPDGVDGEEVMVSINETAVGNVTVDSGWAIDPEIRNDRITVADTLAVDVLVSHTGDTEATLEMTLYDAYDLSTTVVSETVTVGTGDELMATLERDQLLSLYAPMGLFGLPIGGVMIEQA